MAYWLFKSEPETFSLADLQKMQRSPWDGVRNYQARNHIRSMEPGDLGFFYHSRLAVPGIAGILKVVSLPRPDPTALDPASPYFDPKSTPENNRWTLVEVEFGEVFPHFVNLEDIRKHSKLSSMVVARKGNRLSITPVTQSEWKVLVKLGRGL